MSIIEKKSRDFKKKHYFTRKKETKGKKKDFLRPFLKRSNLRILKFIGFLRDFNNLIKNFLQFFFWFFIQIRNVPRVTSEE